LQAWPEIARAIGHVVPSSRDLEPIVGSRASEGNEDVKDRPEH
jgi:hypothetical protein